MFVEIRGGVDCAVCVMPLLKCHAVRRHRLPRPLAVKPDELRSVRIQDVCGQVALLTLLRKHHDHEPTCAYVFCVTAQTLEFLGRSKRPQQAPLELRKEPMVCSAWIKAVQALLTAQNVDVRPLEALMQ